jgi:hypothetical protein
MIILRLKWDILSIMLKKTVVLAIATLAFVTTNAQVPRDNSKAEDKAYSKVQQPQKVEPSIDVKPYQWRELYAPANLSNWILAILAGLAGIVALRTLRATENAAEAAKDSLDLSRDTAKKQLRAYFGAVEGRLYIHDDGFVEPRVTLTNYGQTPAYGFQITQCGRFENHPFRKVPPPQQNSMPPHPHIVGAGQPYHFTCKKVDSRQDKDSLKRALSSSGLAFILNGWCTYKDIFEDSHHFNFQLIIGGGTAVQKTIDRVGEWLGFFTDSEGNSFD